MEQAQYQRKPDTDCNFHNKPISKLIFIGEKNGFVFQPDRLLSSVWLVCFCLAGLKLLFI